MKQLFTILLSVVALWACDPTFENPPKEEVPEIPQRPENAISTLTENVEVQFDASSSLCYADCFGDYYHTGLYMWQFYFMDFESKESLCIEVMAEPNDLTIPTGAFLATNDIYKKNGLLRGIIDEDGYRAYSWYIRLAKGGVPSAEAPVDSGMVEIIANEDGSHTAIFNLGDDALNWIHGSHTTVMIVEDFRINH